MTDHLTTSELALPSTYDAQPVAAEPAAPSPLAAALGMLRGRYRWAIGLGSVFAVAGALIGYRIPVPTYRTVALIDIAPKVPKVLTDTDEKGVLPLFDAYVGSQAELISTRRVVDQAMSSAEWRAVGPSGTDASISDFMKGLEVVHMRNTQLVSVAYSHPDPQVAVVAVNQVVKAYMNVVMENKNAGGVQLLNAIENQLSVINNKLNDLRADVLSVTDDLGEGALKEKYTSQVFELNEIENVLHDLDVAIATAKAANQLGATALPRELTEQEIAASNPAMESLLWRRAEAEAKVMALETNDKMGPKNPELIEAKDAVSFLMKQIQERAKAIRALSADAPDVRVATLRENESKRALLVELRDGIQDDIRRLSRKRLALDTIAAEQLVLEEQRSQLKRRLEQISLESEGKDRITVMSFGERAVAPDTDRRLPFAMMGAGGGLALGFALVLLWGLSESKLRHLEDVGGDDSRGRFLGVIPELPGDGAAHVEAEDGRDPGEMGDYCVHHIRTMLQLRSAEHKAVIALTSPSPGAGKTTVGLALGMSFAAAGSRTLLIDCDFVGHGLTSSLRSIVCDGAGRALLSGVSEPHQPAAPVGIVAGLLAARRMAFDDAQIDELLVETRARATVGDASSARVVRCLESLSRSKPNGVSVHSGRRGILGALDGRPLADCVIETDLPHLSVLPVGDALPQDAKYLSRAGLEKLVRACRDDYDTVLIDTGPVLGSIEAAFVTAAADAVLLVVSRGERRPAVDEAIKRIDQFGAGVAGVIFNRATTADVARSSYASRSQSRAAERA